MSYITTIASHKGGCGKSTTALYLIGGLYKRGYKTLLIDLDERMTLSHKMAAPDGPTIADVIRGAVPAADAIQAARFCDIIPAGPELVTPEFIFKDGPGREYHLKKALEPIRENYDFIFFDCAGSMNSLTSNALTASDAVIIPTISDEDAINGIKSMFELCQDIQEYTNKELKIAGVLFTGYDSTIFGRAMLDNARAAAARGNMPFFPPIKQTTEIKGAKFSAGEINILDGIRRAEVKKEINDFIDMFIKEANEK